MGLTFVNETDISCQKCFLKITFIRLAKMEQWTLVSVCRYVRNRDQKQC